MAAHQRNQAAAALRHLADDIETGGRKLSPKLADAIAAELQPEDIEALAELEDGDAIEELTYEKEWIRACEERVANLRAGNTKTVPASKVLEELRAELSRGR